MMFVKLPIVLTTLRNWSGRCQATVNAQIAPELAPEMDAFFERFFAFHRVLERGPGAFTILNNDEDFVLTLMKAKKHDPVGYPETFHVGFYLDDPTAVRDKHDELAAAGLAPGEIQGERNMRGTHFYCTAPGNVVIEVATPPKL